jgi:hypothetical protein
MVIDLNTVWRGGRGGANIGFKAFGRLLHSRPKAKKDLISRRHAAKGKHI